MTRHPLYGMVMGLVVLIGSLTALEAAAQTALLDVKDGPTPLFHVNDDGGLVGLGAFGIGVIPATGPGTRLMWHPAKAAFRAGSVFNTQWDEANVGDYSVAMGLGTTASGNLATAMGNQTMATGFVSVAMGQSTTASGQGSTAMGASTEASGDYATAIGNGTTASSDYATAMGRFTTASGQESTAMGASTEASGNYATAMGHSTVASGLTSTAMGDDTEASGNYATAMGHSTVASGLASMATGDDTEASGNYATALGNGTTASGYVSTTLGLNTTSTGNYATALGNGTTAQAYASLALGRYNVVQGDEDTWVATDPVLVVGNGITAGTRSNAFTLLKNGNLTIAGTLTQNSDRRLKRDIRPLSDALSALRRLQPVRFRFRAGTNRPDGVHIGLIAQEVQAVFPELVQQGADGYLSVSYTNLTAVLVQALNEQQDQIEAYQNEIAALNERLARLEALLAGAGTETAAER